MTEVGDGHWFAESGGDVKFHNAGQKCAKSRPGAGEFPVGLISIVLKFPPFFAPGAHVHPRRVGPSE